ncbi:hypothetical protein [Novosphingobium sp.]|nr:hypothetical protein [Novosphingobium sp.]
MVDIFALSVAHAALLVALLRLVQRPELDREGPAEPVRKLRSKDAPRA